MEILINLMLIFSFAFSLLFKLMNYLAFYRLYKASGNMSGSSLDIIKQIKRRFSDCFTLGKPIENTESYIRRILLSSDKYLQSLYLRAIYISFSPCPPLSLFLHCCYIKTFSKIQRSKRMFYIRVLYNHIWTVINHHIDIPLMLRYSFMSSIIYCVLCVWRIS